MKSLSLLITFLIIVSTNLSARENPFEPTQTYEAEVARLIEIDEDYPYEFQEKADQEAYQEELKKSDEEMKITQEEMHTQKPVMNEMSATAEIKDNKPMTPATPPAPVMKISDEKMSSKKMPDMIKEPTEKTVTAKQEDNTQISKIADAKEVLINNEPPKETKTITLESAMKELDKVVVEVPKRTDIEIHENIDILPFVNLDFTNNKIEINSKYDVFRKFTIDESNKIVLDYHAKTFFLTKVKKLDTEFYDKIVIGNHLKDRYFRIVIVLKNQPNKYKVTYTDKLVTVIFDKDMI